MKDLWAALAVQDVLTRLLLQTGRTLQILDLLLLLLFVPRFRGGLLLQLFRLVGAFLWVVVWQRMTVGFRLHFHLHRHDLGNGFVRRAEAPCRVRLCFD